MNTKYLFLAIKHLVNNPKTQWVERMEPIDYLSQIANIDFLILRYPESVRECFDCPGNISCFMRKTVDRED
jgi:hypothetical protein